MDLAEGGVKVTVNADDEGNQHTMEPTMFPRLIRACLAAQAIIRRSGSITRGDGLQAMPVRAQLPLPQQEGE
jgi:hypothetical protein